MGGYTVKILFLTAMVSHWPFLIQVSSFLGFCVFLQRWCLTCSLSLPPYPYPYICYLFQNDWVLYSPLFTFTYSLKINLKYIVKIAPYGFIHLFLQLHNIVHSAYTINYLTSLLLTDILIVAKFFVWEQCSMSLHTCDPYRTHFYNWNWQFEGWMHLQFINPVKFPFIDVPVHIIRWNTRVPIFLHPQNIF